MDIASQKFNNLVGKKFSIVVISFLIVYLSGSLLISNEDLISSLFIKFLYLLLIMLSLLVNLDNINYFLYIKKKLVFLFCLFVFFFLINIVRMPSKFLHLTIRIIWFLTFYILCTYNEPIKKQIDKCIYITIVILAGISLFIFIMLYVIKLNIPKTKFIVEGLEYRSILGIYYIIPQAKVNFLGQTIYRVQSIFWEPGVFAVHLCLALYYGLFVKKHMNLFISIILYFTILTTFSTTGIIVSTGILGFYLLTSNKLTKGLKSFILSIVIPLVIPFLVSVWKAKKYGENNQLSGSYNLRMFDLVYSFNLLKENPLFGTGYNNEDAYKAFFKSITGYERGSSNGLVSWIVTTGILGTILFFTPFFIKMSRSKEKLKYLCFFLSFIMLNMTEPLMLTPLMIYYLANTYCLRDKGI